VAVCRDKRRGRVQGSLISLTRSPTVVADRGLTRQEGTALLVRESNAAASALAVKAIRCLEDPNEGQDGKGEGGPVDEGGGALVIEDGPQGPRDDESAGKITLDGRERVSGCSGLEEQEGEEDEDLSPDTSVM